MSRSALQKEFLKKQSQMLTAVSAPAPPPEFLQLQQQQHQYFMQQYQAQQAAMMGVPGMVPMVPMMPMAPGAPGVDPVTGTYAPIPLTGDEDDNEGPTGVKSNALPMYGNTTNFNINNLLFNNIMENEYFRALYQLRTYHEVIDEIYRSVDHVEPWQTGTARFPSSAFCLLVKFMLMKLTLKQMNGLLATTDCANVRAIGLLYLRYTCPPTDLFKWYEPYLEDPEVFSPGADKSVTTTIGEYCTKLLVDMQYFGTTLPRIPVPIERKMKVFLLLLEEKKKRRRTNQRDKERGLFSVGAKVRAIYADEDNEPAWYEAVIDSVDEECTDGNKFWVTFPEYGNTEKVDLGDMELLPAPGSSAQPGDSRGRKGSESRSRSRDRGDRDRESGNNRSRDGRDGRRSSSRDYRERDGDGRRDDRYRRRDDSRDRSYRDRSRDRESRGGGSGSGVNSSASTGDLLQQVLQSQREASAAVGKNYGHRPTSYKGSLSLKQDRYTARRKSPSPADRHHHGGGGGGARRRGRSRSRSPPPRAGNAGGGAAGGSAEEQAKRMRMLKEKYGDASAP
mmetsp:Transcript_60413/g.118907  ORF Transcript_60413/g.118907 Transcript_60413/m.118907 type:complete len:562 (+) Transcript_60413:55-1740(+)|eukprot:CAMPEP_0170379208 /NCGR_PEP_ID=MMETSP0117_2-20130122/13218_1 /TAXON_ID=400756 /ORGANISM="Durinskia baltica, Strain CSIRO CS-38" /LENGTH=561 /DNA_ID=CAMNT_0010634627 /DNA_START=50 /DNA_END=1735 /DNA_ORIENTATION=+